MPRSCGRAWSSCAAATPRRTPTAAEVLALAGRHPDDWAGDEDVPLPVTAVHAQGWIGDLLEGRAERAITPVAAPPGFRAQLRPYQQRGLSWLAFLAELGLGALLADDMGLGKTVQLLALEAYERHAAARGPTLLLCPMSLVGTWQREAERFAPELRVLALHGPGRPHGDALRRAGAAADLVVTTYATATRDVEELAAIGVAPPRARRGPGGQEQPGVGRARGAQGRRRAPRRAHRHARWRTGSRSCGR